MPTLPLAAAVLALGAILPLFVSCTDTTTGQASSPSPSMSIGSASRVPPSNLSQEELRLGFLAAYIKGDRQEAGLYATPQALAKLPWVGRPRTDYLPHFDDRKIFWFDGGLAHVVFGQAEGRNMITDFEVHFRR